MTVTVRQARVDDLDALAGLFDGYRQFYGRPADLPAARAFLSERLQAKDSVILVAESDGTLTGFAQLYPSFSSVAMARIYILNDLFVSAEHRGTHSGQALLDAARGFARDQGAIRLTLSTQLENHPAQRLYEKNGWVRDEQFCVYNLQLTD